VGILSRDNATEGAAHEMAKKTARQRLEDWAASEGIDLTFAMQYDHDEGIGWNISFFIEGRRREPSVSFDAHGHTLEEASEGLLTGMNEYGITVPEGVH
jgi:hypothetical protein